MASEFIQSKGIAIYNASFYENRQKESLLAGTWAVDNFLSSMACANEETQKRMIWGTLLHLRKVAFSDDYTTCFLGASYNHIFSHPLIRSHLNYMFSPADVTDLLDYASRNFQEGDSLQKSFCYIVLQLQLSGHVVISDLIQPVCKQLQELHECIRQNPIPRYKNAYVRYSFLLCCYRIQLCDKSPMEKEDLYILLYKEWRIITRIISIFSGIVVGCEFTNFASLTANMKGHIEFAHLYLKAARTDKGKRNKYSGKSGVDHLQKLEVEMLKQQYERNISLDKIYTILFPSTSKQQSEKLMKD